MKVVELHPTDAIDVAALRQSLQRVTAERDFWRAQHAELQRKVDRLSSLQAAAAALRTTLRGIR